MSTEIGRKQYALLLLIQRMKAASTAEVQGRLEAGCYKTVQGALNKLVNKNLLKVEKNSKGLLIYSSTPAGVTVISNFVGLLCPKCFRMELIRELYR